MYIHEIYASLIGCLVAMGIWLVFWWMLLGGWRRDRRERAVRDALRALDNVRPDAYGGNPREPGLGPATVPLTEWYVLRAALRATLGTRDRRRLDGIREVGRAGAAEMRGLLKQLLAESVNGRRNCRSKT